MKIALVFDAQNRPDTTGIHCLQALKQIVDVDHFSPSDLAYIPRRGYDLYLQIDDGLKYRFPRELRPSAWWVIDTHLSYDWDLLKASDFDWIFTAQKDAALRMHDDGISNAQWLPLAFNPVMHHLCDITPDLDIAFVGNSGTAERNQLLQAVAQAFPKNFIGNAYGEELALKYSQAKIGLNRSILNDLNMRVFEVLGCGRLLITNNIQNNGQDELFTHQKHLVTYETTDELIQHIAYYLVHDEERETIARQGHIEALEHHTYHHRMKKIIETTTAGVRPALSVKPKWYYHFTRPELLALIPSAASNILDVGCSAGRLGEALKQRQTAKVTGIELDSQAAQEAQGRLDRVICDDVEKMELSFTNEEFDCIILGDILEHLQKPLELIKRLKPFLNQRGQLILSVPNVRNGQVIIDLCEGNWRYENAGILDYDHLRFFTLTDIRALLRQSGFHIKELRRNYDTQYAGWKAAGAPKNIQLGYINYTAQTNDVEEFFVTQYIIVAQPETAFQTANFTTSIIIPVFNQLEYTRQCLESLELHTHGSYEVIIIDNGSTDGTAEYLASLPWVKVITNEENLGFIKACNQGITAARGEYLVLLNNDTVLTANWLTKLIRLAEHDEQIGMIGPVTNCSSGPQQININYDNPAEMEQFAQQIALTHGNELIEIERLVGFCLLMKRHVVERIGILDESFGIGLFDDDDLSLRARMAGYKLVYTPGVFIHHYGSQTFKGMGIDTATILKENWQHFKDKWQNDQVAVNTINTLYKPLTTDQSINAQNLPTQITAPSVSGRKQIALCMIVRNEENNLGRCLSSVHDLMDEIIIVDTGSTDNTKAIAAQYGAQIYDFIWCDDFSKARNESLKYATSDWILWLDADDSLDEVNRNRLVTVLQDERNDITAYVMKVRCLSSDPASTTVVDHVKMFRNDPAIRFEYRIHEQILPAIRRMGGEVAWTDVEIIHHGYQDPGLRTIKLERDRRILNNDLAAKPDDPFSLFNLGCIEQELKNQPAAITAFQKSIALSSPADSQVRKAYAMLLQLLRDTNQTSNALQTASNALRLFPKDPEILFHSGLLYLSLGDTSQAERCLVAALDMPPDKHLFSSLDPGIYGYKTRHNLAVLYAQTGRIQEAQQQFLLAVREQPLFIPAWDALLDIRATTPDKELTLSSLLNIAQEAGASAQIIKWIQARIAMIEEQFDEVVTITRQLMNEGNTTSAVLRLLTHALLRSGNIVQAEHELRHLSENDKTDGECLYNLAVLLLERGDLTEAEQAVKEAINRVPTQINAHHLLTEIQHRLGQV